MSEKAPRTPPPPKEKLTSRGALIEIRKLLSDPSLSDSACIEAICRVYERLPDMPEAEYRPSHRQDQFLKK